MRTAVSLIPLAGLLIEYAAKPAVWETRVLVPQVQIADLLSHDRVELGTYRAHRLYAAIDNVAADSFLSDVPGANAFLTSVFVTDNTSPVTIGSLGRTITSRLVAVDPVLGHRFSDWMSASGSHAAGDALGFPLGLPDTHRNRFRVDEIVLVTMDEGPSNGGRATLGQALSRAIALAGQDGADNVVIPCLGYNWEDNSTINLTAYFNLLLDNISVGPDPKAVHVSLYSNWPTFALENAVGALNDSWRRHIPSNSLGSSLYRYQVRLTLLILPVCLFVSLRFTETSIKSITIISLAYVGAVAAGDQLVSLFLSDVRSTSVAVLQTLIRLMIALALPFTIHWKFDDLFRRRR